MDMCTSSIVFIGKKKKEMEKKKMSECNGILFTSILDKKNVKRKNNSSSLVPMLIWIHAYGIHFH